VAELKVRVMVDHLLVEFQLPTVMMVVMEVELVLQVLLAMAVAVAVVQVLLVLMVQHLLVVMEVLEQQVQSQVHL
jgi:hypothetical protein